MRRMITISPYVQPQVSSAEGTCMMIYIKIILAVVGSYDKNYKSLYVLRYVAAGPLDAVSADYFLGRSREVT